MRPFIAPLLALPLVIALGCVDAPKFLDAGPPEPIDQLCPPSSPCQLPPEDFPDGAINLLPAVVADVEGDDKNDLVIGNSPEEGSFWGVLVAPSIDDQVAQLQATPFTQTCTRSASRPNDPCRRPSAIHVEEDPELPTRIFVFGTDPDNGDGVTIYAYDSISKNLVPESEIGGIVTPSGGADQVNASLISALQFDGEISNQYPDVAVVHANQLWVARCNDSGCPDEFTLVENAPDLSAEPGLQVFPATKNVRALSTRPTLFADSGGNIVTGDGREDLLLSGDGNLRWVTYARPGVGGADDWRSLQQYVDFSAGGREGVMGTMSAGVASELVTEDGAASEPDLILAGPTNIDVTALSKSGSDVLPIERYKYRGGDGDEEFESPRSPITVSFFDSPAIVFLEVPATGNSNLVVLPFIEGFPPPVPDANAADFGDGLPVVRTPLGQPGAQSVMVDGNDQIFVLFADGSCQAFTFDATPAVTRVDGRECKPPG